MKNKGFLSLLVERIQKFGPSLGGVFSYGDLFNLVGHSSPQANKRTIRNLVRDGFIFKVQRGYYITRNPDLWVLACRLNKKAYVSMDSVLAKNALIGPLPTSVTLVYSGWGRKIIKTPFGDLRFYSTKGPRFGTLRLPNGVVAADNEKAYLDLLYYYCRGVRFVVDPRTDVHLWRLNIKKIRKYLRFYRNPKFRKFVEEQFDEDY